MRSQNNMAANSRFPYFLFLLPVKKRSTPNLQGQIPLLQTVVAQIIGTSFCSW